jgi:hypothetical protein
MKKILCFDIDGVICSINKSNDYSKSKPIKKNIKFINLLYYNGYKIILFSSRFMGRYNDNAKKAKKKGFIFTKTQMNLWGLKYHKLLLGKPSYDLIVDDKSLFFKKHWIKCLSKLLLKK